MKLLVLLCVLASYASAAPQGYGASGGGGPPAGGCSNGEVLNVDGTCAVPKVTQQVYVYAAPHQPIQPPPPPQIPPPELVKQVLFIRAPEPVQRPNPIVLPAPETKSVVYVLNRQEDVSQQVIHTPAQPPTNPEVYFVNYREGDNPQLPGGGDLQSALGSATTVGGGFVGGNNVINGGLGQSSFQDVSPPSGLYSTPF